MLGFRKKFRSKEVESFKQQKELVTKVARRQLINIHIFDTTQGNNYLDLSLNTL
eukprot:m.57748 g.57748  ORF g.57748 m.57748 type:complete len:54 (+) comp22428_c0_seq1:76-237(+)